MSDMINRTVMGFSCMDKDRLQVFFNETALAVIFLACHPEILPGMAFSVKVYVFLVSYPVETPQTGNHPGGIK